MMLPTNHSQPVRRANVASSPGRPPKLDHEERTEVHKVLEGSPESAGYDAEEWNTALVQRLLEEQFYVEYSRTSAFRFLTSNS
jgi:transposase